MADISIKTLYQTFVSQERELVRNTYNFDANSNFFTGEGDFVLSTQGNVNIQHGIALQSLDNLRHAYNQVINAFGTLNSRVESASLKQAMGLDG